MRYIFFYNEETFEYIGADTIADNAQVPANATLLEPVDDNGIGLYDPVWNTGTQTWTGISESEWLKKHGVVEEPSLEQKLQAKQTVLIAGLAKDVKMLQGAVKTLVMQNAMNSKEEK
ncbi:hypothetical protein INF23_04695 [Ligilactobacillus salivarius]|uniref:hypothetical protein n=1 Tax=Ligilactobacillus salivarius TaxID=1624 RepID=UPI00187506A6|nr:hypothetical protein [Ligilactobacillus salivarius]MBE5066902.1 hypothetical protein [Ligilactobacillus salivarius]